MYFNESKVSWHNLMENSKDLPIAFGWYIAVMATDKEIKHRKDNEHLDSYHEGPAVFCLEDGEWYVYSPEKRIMKNDHTPDLETSVKLTKIKDLKQQVIFWTELPELRRSKREILKI